MSWKRLDVDPDAVARGAAAALTAAFAAAFANAGAPRNAALFEGGEDGGLQFYFSPGACLLFEQTLKTFALKKTGAPPPGARLAVGDPGTWSPGAPDA